MAGFGFEYSEEGKELVSQFIEETNNRLLDFNMVRNPFYGKIKNKHNWAMCYIKPLYPNPFIIGVMFSIIAMFFTGFKFSFWLFPPLFIMAVGLLYTKYFYYVILKLGLRKKGYKNSLKLLSSEELTKRLVYGSD